MALNVFYVLQLLKESHTVDRARSACHSNDDASGHTCYPRPISVGFFRQPAQANICLAMRAAIGVAATSRASIPCAVMAAERVQIDNTGNAWLHLVVLGNV